MPMDWSKFATPVLLAVVVLFVLYRRVRRSVGRQPLRGNAMRFRLLLLALVAGILLLSPTMTPTGRVAAVLGALAGAGLAAFALRHTKFESGSEGQFYTPHLYIGLAVIALLLARMGYRMFQVYGISGAAGGVDPNAAPVAVSTPLTIGLLFATIGYYGCYLGGLLRWSRRATAVIPPPAPAPPA